VNANTIVAICAVVVAAAALVVSVSEARATRKHNRYSVRPILKLTTTFPVGKKAGLILSNSGLGPADVTASSLSLDGEELGAFDERTVNKVRDRLSVRPSAFALGGQTFLKTDFDRFLLSVEPYDHEEHKEFYEFIRHRLRVEIWYDSLYGREQFKAVHLNVPKSKDQEQEEQREDQ